MALSKKAKDAIHRAVTDKHAAEELIELLEAQSDDNDAIEAVEDDVAALEVATAENKTRLDTAAAVTAIADPGNATAEINANKINEILAALQVPSAE